MRKYFNDSKAKDSKQLRSKEQELIDCAQNQPLYQECSCCHWHQYCRTSNLFYRQQLDRYNQNELLDVESERLSNILRSDDELNHSLFELDCLEQAAFEYALVRGIKLGKEIGYRQGHANGLGEIQRHLRDN